MNQEEVLLPTDQLEDGAVTVQTEKYLLFMSGDLLFGVPAESVAEIITGHTITKLPLVPGYIRGIINLRGQIIPIVDIRRLLNHGDCENGGHRCVHPAARSPPELQRAGVRHVFSGGRSDHAVL